MVEPRDAEAARGPDSLRGLCHGAPNRDGVGDKTAVGEVLTVLTGVE
jgi:hypothetical protein